MMKARKVQGVAPLIIVVNVYNFTIDIIFDFICDFIHFLLILFLSS